MNRMPLVSVVIPAYQHSAFIGECLDSLAGQTYPNIEVLLIDDQSPDSTFDLARATLDSAPLRKRFAQITCRQNPSRMGAHASLNQGIELAQGEYVFFLNSDDRYHPLRISRMVDAMQTGSRRFAFSAVNPIRSPGGRIHDALLRIISALDQEVPSLPTLSFAFLRENCALTSGNLALQRDLLQAVGPFANLALAHDWDFALRALAIEEPLYVNEPLYDYRLHASNTFNAVADRAPVETQVCLARYFELINSGRVRNRLAPSPFNWPIVFEHILRQWGHEALWQRIAHGYVAGSRTTEVAPGAVTVRQSRPRDLSDDLARIKRTVAPHFDAQYYVTTYGVAAGVDPLEHFLQTGWHQGFNPAPDFDTKFYLEQHADIRAGGINPYYHYLSKGRAEGRTSRSAATLEGYCNDFPGARRQLDALRSHFADPTKDVAATFDATASGNLYEEAAAILADVDRQRIVDFKERPVSYVAAGPDDRAASGNPVVPADSTHAPSVSIIIPVYGQLALARDCLHSVVLGLLPTDRAEVILVDDKPEESAASLAAAFPGVRYLRNETNLGFLRACNRAIQEARGEFVLLLNSDVQVPPGFLENMLLLMRSDPRVGVVGPRLVYPNGRLQEAGCTLNEDGSAVMIGLNDDPEAPEYLRTREVDYCSGACLLVRTEVLRKAGGLDERYAPSYCEDVDLCLSARQQGWRVMYCAEVKVVHHLSASHDALGRSIKLERCSRNQQKLVEKWPEMLTTLNQLRVIAVYPRGAGGDAPTPARLRDDAARAVRYGIDGLCLASGGPELRLIRSDPALDLQFCVMAGAGQDPTVLQDARYLKIDGRPLVLATTPHMDAARELTAAAQDLGCAAPLLVALEQPGHGVPHGFHALLEAVPNAPAYAAILRSVAARRASGPLLRRAVAGDGSTTATGGEVSRSPEAFEAHLDLVIRRTREQHTGDWRVLFVDGWGDSGFPLAADPRLGHRWLEAVRNARLRAGVLPMK